MWVLPLASRLTLLSTNTWRVNMGGLSVRIRSRMALVVLGVTAFLLLAGVVATVAGWDGLTDVAILVLLALGVAVAVDTRLKVGAIRRESQQVRRSQRQVLRDSRKTRATVRGLRRRSLALERRVIASDRAVAEREKGLRDGVAKSLAAVERERSVAERRHVEVLRRVGSIAKSKDKSEVAELAALLQYQERIPARALLPTVGGFAMNPRSLAHLVDLVDRHQPRTVLELGSGTSSVWLGYLLEGVSGASVVSVDHLHDYAEMTRSSIARHGLQNTVDVRLAPLVSYPVEVSETPWYDSAAFEDVRDIDLLIVDGPPQATGPLSRLPALRVLAPRLARGAIIVLDDAGRPDEEETVRLWVEEFELERLDVGVSRLAVLQRRRPAR